MMDFSKSYVENIQKTLQVPQLQFRSDKTHNVFTVRMDKEYKVVSTKKRKLDKKTIPYGTKE
jgi:hypothetical protein